MDIKAFHDLFLFMLNREHGGWFSPEDIDMLAHRAQMWLFDQLLPGYMKSRESADALSGFIENPDSPLTSSDGVFALSQYEALLSLGVFVAGGKTREVRIVRPDELAGVLGSQITSPATYYPVAVDRGSGVFKIYPEDVYRLVVMYLRTPAKPYMKYTIGTDGRSINYTALGSVHLDWPESQINQILVKALQLAGVNISDQMIIQFTEMKNREGI